jgi:hypothetical protein
MLAAPQHRQSLGLLADDDTMDKHYAQTLNDRLSLCTVQQQCLKRGVAKELSLLRWSRQFLNYVPSSRAICSVFACVS